MPPTRSSTEASAESCPTSATATRRGTSPYTTRQTTTTSPSTSPASRADRFGRRGISAAEPRDASPVPKEPQMTMTEPATTSYEKYCDELAVTRQDQMAELRVTLAS